MGVKYTSHLSNNLMLLSGQVRRGTFPPPSHGTVLDSFHYTALRA